MKKIKGLSIHLKNILVVYFNTYLAIAVASYAMTAITRDPMDIARMHLLMLLPLYLYIIRRKIRHLLPFALCHLLAAAPILIYWIPQEWIGVFIMGVAIVILIAHSFALRLIDAKNEATLGGMLVLCGAFAIGYFCADIPVLNIGAQVQPYLLWASALTLMAFFINMHTKNVNSTLNNVNEMLNQPAQKIRRFNNKILIYFMIGTAVFIVLGVTLHVEQVVIAIGQLLLMIIRFLVSLLPKGKAPVEESSIIEEELVPSEREPMTLPDGEAAMIWEYLEKIVTVLTFVAIIAGIIYGLYRFYKWFYSRKVDVVTADEYEETSVYMEEKEKTVRKKESLWERFKMSNEKKVRRLYRKRLEEPMKTQEKVKISDSPKEILEKLPSPELAVLTEVYEKARYSQEPITKEDLKRSGG